MCSAVIKFKAKNSTRHCLLNPVQFERARDYNTIRKKMGIFFRRKLHLLNNLRRAGKALVKILRVAQENWGLYRPCPLVLAII